MPVRSRRDFLRDSTLASGGLAAALSLPAVVTAAAAAQKAHAKKASFKVLSMLEATEIDAITAQIIPTDETPGAREAGVVYFIDEAFATFMAGALPGLRGSLEEFQAGVPKMFAGKASFVTLSDQQQIDYLSANEQAPAFGFLQFLTNLGFFANPSYRGNRDHIGWKLIGFEHQHAWVPPFGYYDAQVLDNDN